MLVYMVIGVFGVVRFGQSQPSQIFKTDGKLGYSPSNKGALAARFLMAISALFTCPLVAITMRISAGQLFFPIQSKGNTKRWRLVSSLVIVTFGTLLACTMTQLEWFNFFVGISFLIFGAVLMFIFPAIMYMNLAPKHLRRWPYKIMLAIGIVMLLVFVPWKIVDKATGKN